MEIVCFAKKKQDVYSVYNLIQEISRFEGFYIHEKSITGNSRYVLKKKMDYFKYILWLGNSTFRQKNDSRFIGHFTIYYKNKILSKIVIVRLL